MTAPIKNRLFILALAGFIVFAGNVANAQQARHLSLQEAVELGLQNSKQLKSSQAAIDEAAARLQESKMNRLPDLKVSAAYMRLNNPTVDLKIPLSSGSGDSTGSSESSGGFPKVNQVMYGMANASLPLFSGLRIHNGIESMKYLKRAAELDVEKDKTEIVQNTIAAYYNLYKATEAVKLMQENLKQAQSRVTDFTNMEKNGLLARNDLLKAELQQSNVELTLSDAENNRNIAQYNLGLLLGIDAGTQLDLDSLQTMEMPQLKTMDEWQQLAVNNRGDYLSLSQKQLAAEKNVQVAKGAYYPSVALTGGYVAGHIPDVVTITNAMNVGVGLSYNLAELYKNGSKVKQAKAQQSQLYWSSQQLSDGIRLQVYQAYENYREALKKINVYKKAVDQANENYRITKNKYDNALETTTNLLDADVAQLQANINYQFAKVDALVAYNKLFETAGLINPQITK